MATHPDSRSENARGAGRSWSAVVAAARKARAPRVDTAAAVMAAIAEEEQSARDVAVADDGWTEFARIFATPRLVFSGAASLCAAGPLALWVVTSGCRGSMCLENSLSTEGCRAGWWQWSHEALCTHALAVGRRTDPRRGICRGHRVWTLGEHAVSHAVCKRLGRGTGAFGLSLGQIGGRSRAPARTHARRARRGGSGNARHGKPHEATAAENTLRLRAIFTDATNRMASKMSPEKAVKFRELTARRFQLLGLEELNEPATKAAPAAVP